MASMILGSLGIAVISASCYCGMGYFHTKHLAEDEQLAVERVEQANADLTDAIGTIADKVKELQHDTDEINVVLDGLEASDDAYRQTAAVYDETISKLDRLIASYMQRVRQARQHLVYEQLSRGSSGMLLHSVSTVAYTIASLMQAYYPAKVTDAFLQRIKIESGFNPQAVSPDGYKCLVQWDHSRYHQLLRFARYTPREGQPCPPVEQQVAFIHHEMSSRDFRQVTPRAVRGDAYHEVTAGYFKGVE